MSETPGGDREAIGNDANPYVGPKPFGPSDPLYGRDREVRALRDLLISQRIVVFYSPSGAGKTSLIDANAAAPLPEAEEAGGGAVNDVHAGLRWEMARARFRVLPVIRVNQEPKQRPKANANRYVLSALLSLEENHPSGKPRKIAALASMTLAQYLAEWPRTKDSLTNDVLIFDQFEELLTLDPTDRDAKEAFLTQVREVLRDGDRWALFSLREDHLGGLDPYAAEIPTRLATSYRLDLLGPEAAKLAMQNPADRSGVEFPEDAAQKLLDDLRRVRAPRPGDSAVEQLGLYVEPVHLQVVCRRLWDQAVQRERRIDRALVAEVGAVDDALEHFYATAVAEVVAETGVPERTIRGWFEERLITGHGIRNQVIQEDEQAGGLATEVVDALVARHLVRREPRRGVPWLELAHDRLIPPILANNKDWRLDNLNSAQQAATAWDSGGRQPGFLLTGDALTQAETWAKEQGESLTDVERSFLDASRQQRGQQTLSQTKKALAAAVLLALIAVVVAFVFDDRRRDADEQRTIAQDTAADLAQVEQIRRSQFLAKQAEDERNRGLGFLLAAEALHTSDTPEARQAMLALLRTNLPPLAWDQPTAVFAGGTGEVRGLAFDPQSNFLVSITSDGLLQRWSTGIDAAPDPQATASISGTSRSLALFVGDPVVGPKLVTGGSAGVQLWHPESLRMLEQISVEDVTSVAFSHDGSKVVYGGADGHVVLYDTDTGESASLLEPSDNGVNAVAYSRDGWIAAGRDDGAITLWDNRSTLSDERVLDAFSETRDLRRIGEAGPAVTSLAFKPSTGEELAAGDSDGEIWRWDVTTGYQIGTTALSQGESAIGSLAYSRDVDGGLIAVADHSGAVALWDVGSAAIVATLPRMHNAGAWSVAFDPHGLFLASGDGAGEISLWSRVGLPLATEAPTDVGIGSVTAAAISSGGLHLAAASANGLVRLCDLTRTPTTCVTLTDESDEPNAVRSLAFSGDGDRLAWGESSGAVTVASLSGNHERLRRQADSSVEALAFGAEDRTLVAVTARPPAPRGGPVDQPGSIVVWDLEADETASAETEAPPHVRALAANPAAPVIAAYEQAPIIWTIGPDGEGDPPALTRSSSWDLSAPARSLVRVRNLTFDPSGTKLAVAGGGAVVWEVTTGEVVLQDHPQLFDAQSLAFSPNGLQVVTGSGAGDIKLWDLQQGGRFVGVLGKMPAAVVDLAWSTDGTLIALDVRGMVLKMRVDPRVWTTIACQAAGTDFSRNQLAYYFPDASPTACAPAGRQGMASPVPAVDDGG